MRGGYSLAAGLAENMVSDMFCDGFHHGRGDCSAEAFPLLGVGTGEDEVLGEAADDSELGDGELSLLGWVDYRSSC